MFKKVVPIVVSLGIFMHPVSGMAQYMNVQQIYSYAQKGNLQSLHALRHQIDITDSYGNTALCYSVMNNDYKTFNLLRQANANPQSQCINNITLEQIQSFNEGYANWYQTITKQVSNQAMKGVSAKVATTGLSVGAKVGIGVGIVALVGGGIAAAAGGGGGGSSSSDTGNTSGTGSGSGSDSGNTGGTGSGSGSNSGNTGGNGSGSGSDSGNTGGTGSGSGSDSGNTGGTGSGSGSDSGNTGGTGSGSGSDSGNTGGTGSGSGSDSGNTGGTGSGNIPLNCKYGNWNGSVCVCRVGYTGTLCDTPKDIPSGYQATACGAGYDTIDTFLSGETTYYKCTPKDCSAYEINCDAGYNATQSCISGTTQYYTCTPKDIPNGYQATACGAGYDTTDTFLSGTTIYYKCVLKATCTGDKVYNASTNTCICPSNKPNEYNGQCFPACTGNYVFNAGQCVCNAPYVTVNGQCVAKTTCQANETYNPATNTCSCDASYISFNGQCVLKATCTGNKVYNASTNTCVCPSNKPNEYNGQCFPACTGNYVFNAGQCVCNAPYVTVNGQCVAKTTCQANETYNPATNTCSCDASYISFNGQCVLKATCTWDKEYNPITNTCVCRSIRPNEYNGRCYPTCADDKVFSAGECVCPISKPNEYNGQCYVACQGGQEFVNGVCKPTETNDDDVVIRNNNDNDVYGKKIVDEATKTRFLENIFTNQSINITNEGNGNVYGISNQTIEDGAIQNPSYEDDVLPSNHYITITNKGNGNVYGLKELSANAFNKDNALVQIDNQGTGDVYGSMSNYYMLSNAYSVYHYHYSDPKDALGNYQLVNGTISVTTDNSKNVYGMHSWEATNTYVDVDLDKSTTLEAMGLIEINSKNAENVYGIFAQQNETNKSYSTYASNVDVAVGFGSESAGIVPNLTATGLIDITTQDTDNIYGIFAGDGMGIYAFNAVDMASYTDDTVEGKTIGIINLDVKDAKNVYGISAVASENSQLETILGNTYSNSGNDVEGKINIIAENADNIYGMHSLNNVDFVEITNADSDNNSAHNSVRGEINIKGTIGKNIYGIYSSGLNGGEIINAETGSWTESDDKSFTEGIINIESENVENIYGMYNKDIEKTNPNDDDRTEVFNGYADNGKSKGLIQIKSSDFENVYGMYDGATDYNYNAKLINAISEYDADDSFGINNVVYGTIDIDAQNGDFVYGMKGLENISNAYLEFAGKTTGLIDIETTGVNNVYGMYASGQSVKNVELETDRLFNYAQEPVMNAISDGTIRINSKGAASVFGMYGGTNLVNTENVTNNGILYDSVLKDVTIKSTGLIDITAQNTESVYGMYSTGTVYNLKADFGEIDKKLENVDILAESTIKINATDVGTIYGMFGEDVFNAYVGAGTGTATIDIIAKNTDNVYGMYGTESISNSSGDTITINSLGGNYTKTYVDDNGNKQTETVLTSENNNVAVGIYADVATSVENAGNTVIKREAWIDDKGTPETDDDITYTPTDRTGTAYGIYVKGDGYTKQSVTNSGTITIDGIDDAYGIYVYNGADVTVTNTGKINTTSETTALGIVSNSSVINEDTGIITANGNTARGIDGDSVENAGKINVISENGSSLGIISNSSVINEDTGIITVNGNTAIGISAVSSSYDDLKANNGKIIVNGKTDAIGIDGYGNITNTGEIDVDGGKTITGIYGYKGNVLNDKNGIITLTRGGDAYGINSHVSATNHGSINIKGVSRGFGIYAPVGSTITNSGTITITGAGIGYGIYHEGGGSIVNTETGVIDVTATNAYGIYVANGTNTTVTNTGTIKLNGVECTGNCSGSTTNGKYIVLNGATLLNAGTMTAQTMNLDDMGGDVVATKGATFNVQDKLSGTLNVSADTVQNGFDTTYQLSDVIQAGNTDELKLASQSAMFDAQLSGNKNDIMMTMKSFDKMTDNKSLASFLDKNYAQGNNESFFNTLKSFKTGSAFSSSLNSLTGKETLSQFNYEDLSAMREVSLAMNEIMFNNQEQPMFETMGTINSFGFRNDSSSTSQYAIGRKRINSKFNIGYGMSHTNVSSDDDNDTTRRNQIFQAFIPMGYAYRGWQMISTPQMGYARGHYNRKGFNDTTYEGYIEKRIIALTNEARYPMQFGNVELAPTVELNAIAYNQKGKEDDKAYALTIPSENNLSVEAGLGLHAKSQIGNLKLNGGLMVYQEFADPYNIKMGMQGMEGTFDLYDNRSKYRGVGTFGFDYSVGDLNMYGNLQHFIEDDNHTKFKTGLKFKF